MALSNLATWTFTLRTPPRLHRPPALNHDTKIQGMMVIIIREMKLMTVMMMMRLVYCMFKGNKRVFIKNDEDDDDYDDGGDCGEMASLEPSELSLI